MSLIRRAKAYVRMKLDVQDVSEIPSSVSIGRDFRLPHNGIGVVINGHCRIGDHVSILPNAVVGRFDAEMWDYEDSEFSEIVIEDDVIICANAVVIGGPGVTTVGRGCIVGSGAVLLESTGPEEIWAGNPARLVGRRDPAKHPLRGPGQ